MEGSYQADIRKILGLVDINELAVCLLRFLDARDLSILLPLLHQGALRTWQEKQEAELKVVWQTLASMRGIVAASEHGTRSLSASQWKRACIVLHKMQVVGAVPHNICSTKLLRFIQSWEEVVSCTCSDHSLFLVFMPVPLVEDYTDDEDPWTCVLPATSSMGADYETEINYMEGPEDDLITTISLKRLRDYSADDGMASRTLADVGEYSIISSNMYLILDDAPPVMVQRRRLTEQLPQTWGTRITSTGYCLSSLGVLLFGMQHPTLGINMGGGGGVALMVPKEAEVWMDSQRAFAETQPSVAPPVMPVVFAIRLVEAGRVGHANCTQPCCLGRTLSLITDGSALREA